MPTLMLRETLISYDNRYEHYSVPAHIRNISANCFNERWELQWLTLPDVHQFEAHRYAGTH